MPAPSPPSAFPSMHTPSLSSRRTARFSRPPLLQGSPSPSHSGILSYSTRTPLRTRTARTGCGQRYRAICSRTHRQGRTLTSEASFGMFFHSHAMLPLRFCTSVFCHSRYADAPSEGLPGDPGSPDPGPGVDGLGDVDGTTALVSLVPEPAPQATRSYALAFDFQTTAEHLFLGFMNTTVRVMPR